MTLALASPASFSNSIDGLATGGAIYLRGISATSATVNASDQLIVQNGAADVASLQLSGTMPDGPVYVTPQGDNGSLISTTRPPANEPPSISGTAGGQQTSDTTAIEPFGHVGIADPNADQTETLTVTLSSAANGSLNSAGGDSYDSATGVWAMTGSLAAVNAALDALVFTPTAHQVAPGQTVTTSFSMEHTDTAGASATDNSTSVIVTTGTVAPSISGAKADQTTNGTAPISPFSGVVIADPNFGQTETATVTLSTAANGSLSSAGGGSYDTATGVWTMTGSLSAVNPALDQLVFTPSSASLLASRIVTTTFTIQDTDTAGETTTDTTTTVTATASPATVNNSDGTSYLFTYDPTATVTETIATFSGVNNTGSKISDIVDNTDGTSLIYAYDPSSAVTLTAQRWSATNAANGAPAGNKISDVVDDANGACLVYAYNPTSTVTQTTQQWSATNSGNGAPSGSEISDVVDNANGTSLLYSYDPTSTVAQTTSEYSATNAANGAPTGNEISDVVDNTDGTSILYAYNPSSTVSETASFYSATGTAGAPAGTLTSETVDYTAGGSAVTTYSPDGSSSTTYYSGPNGTGSVVEDPPGGFSPTLPDPAAHDVLAGGPSGGTSAVVISAQGLDLGTAPAVTITASNQLIDPGTGNHTIQFASGATADTLVLHLGGSDQVLGFDPGAGDMLDFGSLLTEADLNIGGDIARLASYVSVADVNGSAAIMFNPIGKGGGSQVALLLNDGGIVAQLQTLKAFHA